MLKRTLASALGLLALCSIAAAQGINQVPQVGTISNVIKNPTYTASSVALAPTSAATDVFCISPGTAKNISIKKITIAGTAGTAITTPFLVYKRATLDTGGTAGTSLVAPVAVPMNGSDVASTATLISYTANPTVTDSSPKLMDVLTPSLAVTTTANQGVIGTYGTGSVDLFEKGLDLVKNTTTQICLNLNGATVATGVVNINMVWQEN